MSQPELLVEVTFSSSFCPSLAEGKTSGGPKKGTHVKPVELGFRRDIQDGWSHIRCDYSMKKTSPVSRSGRFASGPGADVARFTESISFDWRLWRHDILGSIVHATMLQKI